MPQKINKKIKNQLKIGIPSYELKNKTLELFAMAGYSIKALPGGSKIIIDDPDIDCVMATAQEILEWIEKGMLDAGIVQKAYLLEEGSEVAEISKFEYGEDIWHNTRLVIAVPEGSSIRKISDLQGQEIFSRLPKLTERFLKSKGVQAKVQHVAYPGEPKAEVFAKPLVEFTNTGQALKDHNFRILTVIMETCPMLIMNSKAKLDQWKRQKTENLATLMQGARMAMDMTGLMLHVSGKTMKEALRLLPAMKKPTVTQLRGENMFDVLTVINKKQARELVPQLKKIGCIDIVEFPLEKVVI